MFNYDNPAELNSKIMADFMNTGAMKFYEFFPQYIHRIYKIDDEVNMSKEMKELIRDHGDNLYK